jgi:hypothetical protein
MFQHFLRAVIQAQMTAYDIAATNTVVRKGNK